MGIDYGRRRIGTAVTDQTGTNIRGLETIDRKKRPDPFPALLSLISRENPDLLVVGLPLDVSDGDTEMSLEARSFAERLQELSGLPLQFVDESFLSIRAHELLRFRKKKERRDKGAVDRLSACLILQQFREEHGCES